MKKIGLALGSGGARGLSHIGVIKVLEKNDISIDMVTGTSMGGLVGAYYALYKDINKLEKVIVSLRKRDYLKMIDLNNPKISFIKGNKIKDFLYLLFGDKRFDDTLIPVKVGATVLEDGSQIVLSKGKLREAVMASASFPFVFPPVRYDGRHLIDGGVVDTTPIDMAFKMKANFVIAVNLFDSRIIESDEFTMMMQFEKIYEILLSNSIKSQSKKHRNVVLLEPKTGSKLQTFAFHEARKFILAGEIEAQKKLEKIRAMIR